MTTTSSRHPVRPTGITLRVLDADRIVREAAEAHPPGEGSTYRAGFAPYAVAEKHGRLYVVCNEGVGWEVTDEAPLEVDLYRETVTEAGKSFAIFPTLSAHLTPEEVRDHATDVEVDLADHIRTFGARLEENFRAWRHALT